LGDLRVVGEVEVAQVAAVLETRGPDAARDVVGIAPREFVIQQQQQELQRVQATLAGFLRARPDGLAHAGELELAQARAERVERQHPATAWASATATAKAAGPRKKAPVAW